MEPNVFESLDALLALAQPDPNEPRDYDTEFDPWRLFPALYGAYSSDFDDLAIAVLSDLRDGYRHGQRRDLAAEMFREMLCTAELCDYGTSPRACFPVREFSERLPALIDKWTEYRKITWGD
jgi:hypothetical protein